MTITVYQQILNAIEAQTAVDNKILAAVEANGIKLDTVNVNLQKLIAAQAAVPTKLSVSLGPPSKREN